MKDYKKQQKMIKSICKSFLFKKSPMSIANKTLSCFSTKLAPQKERLQDWQYVQHIMRQIKENDVNEALSYLIQSHLNNQILNKQIYYSLQEKISQSQMANGYHEILYKLYREHFQPNQMMLSWMKKIAKTENQKLTKLLKEDFQKLNIAFPIDIANSQAVKQPGKSDQGQIFLDQQTKPQSVGRKSRKVPTIASTDEYFSSNPQTIVVKRAQTEQKKGQKIESSEQKELSAENIEQAIVQKFHQVMQMMFKEYGKVTLHNVQLQIDFGEDQGLNIDEEINEMYNENDVPEDQHQHEDHQHNEQQTMEDLIIDTISSIKKIKIGRIEFENSHTLESIKNLRNDLKNDPKNTE